jgi:predicted house-cleaning noncanonical NTP pyrophosphatase (MazG superfamily)
MLKLKFGKLVRDKIVDHQLASGAKPVFRTLDGEEYKAEIIKKINEESKEILNCAPHEIASEIADVQQAIDDLKQRLHLTDEAIRRAQEIKNKKNGPFKRGYFIDYVAVKPDDEWVDYYRKNSDRYPEIT